VIVEEAYDAMLVEKGIVEGVIDCSPSPSAGIVVRKRPRCFDCT
jgi:hypothetical protein